MFQDRLGRGRLLGRREARDCPSMQGIVVENGKTMQPVLWSEKVACYVLRMILVRWSRRRSLEAGQSLIGGGVHG